MTSKFPLSIIDVRAIDIGFGSVKFTTGDAARSPDGAWSIPTASFNSLVCPFERELRGVGCVDQGASVEVDGSHYLVGDDALNFSAPGDMRVLDHSYVKTLQYRVGFAAALKRAGLLGHRVKRLTMGAPVQNFRANKGAIEIDAIGEHVVDGTRVQIDEVLVVPQPIGGFAWEALKQGSASVARSRTTLVVDVGYGTLDWTVCRGLVANAARTHSAMAGVGMIVQAIATRMGEALGQPLTTLNHIESINQHLFNGAEVRIGGRAVDVEPFKSAARPVIDSGLSTLLKSVGALSDIDDIVLVGGGAHLYQSAFIDRAGRGDIRVAEDGRYSNARGFHLMGLSRAGE